MKKLFSILLALAPVITIAQQNDKAPQHQYETSIMSGVGHEDGYGLMNDLYIGSLNTISFYKNINRTQVGIGVDVDINIGHSVFMAPHLILNRTLELRKFNFYAGVMGGYAHLQFDNPTSFTKNKASKGYIAGCQAGMLYKLGKHFAINGELAARGTQLWNKKSEYTFFGDVAYGITGVESYNYFTHYYVGKLGLRYRF